MKERIERSSGRGPCLEVPAVSLWSAWWWYGVRCFLCPFKNDVFLSFSQRLRVGYIWYVYHILNLVGYKGPAACRSIGLESSNPNTTTVLRVVANTALVHNVITCTLCSCYPQMLLGYPPAWYGLQFFICVSYRLCFFSWYADSSRLCGIVLCGIAYL